MNNQMKLIVGLFVALCFFLWVLIDFMPRYRVAKVLADARVELKYRECLNTVRTLNIGSTETCEQGKEYGIWLPKCTSIIAQMTGCTNNSL